MKLKAWDIIRKSREGKGLMPMEVEQIVDYICWLEGFREGVIEAEKWKENPPSFT